MSILFSDKPAGVTTHTSLNESDKRRVLPLPPDGFKEYLEARMITEASVPPLKVVHRLDRGTTGAICFAQSADIAARISALFNQREVTKTYVFLTDRSVDADSFEVESFIERRGSEFVSLPPTASRPANARTRFYREDQIQHQSLDRATAGSGMGSAITRWRAEPETGRPHQIRLHAEQSGIPILGDDKHGGSKYPTLCLHSQSLRFELDGIPYEHSSPAPIWFYKLGLACRPHLVKWLAAIDRRERLSRSLSRALGSDSGAGPSSGEQTLRLIHSDGDPLRVEQLGSVYSLSWFADQLPNSKEWDDLHALAEELNWGPWYLQLRGNRGKAPNEEVVRFGSQEVPTRWKAFEGPVAFEFRRDTGLSPGLFLDQRRNREWVRQNTKDATVLNLFCYTGGFSVCAAMGGAKKTVSVDVSKPFLEWTKTNFSLNQLALDIHEFRAMDSRDYLDWAIKKQLSFDLVICDPPSFGRSKSGVFRIDTDFDSLVKQLLKVTSPGGRILFSTNFEKWDLDDLASRTTRAITQSGIRARLEPTPDPDWDFELPREERNMKSLLIVRV